MLTVYLICLISGGIFVFLSIMFGGDVDSDVEAEFSFHDLLEWNDETDFSGHSGEEISSELWLPFFSLRFWIFSIAFFGLTGSLLSFFEILTSSSLILLTSVVMGMIAGFAMASTMRFLQLKEVSSNISSQDYIGQTGQVILPITPDAPGKIRLLVKDTEVDMIATADEEEGFERGDIAFVIAVDLKKSQVRVVKKSNILNDSEEKLLQKRRKLNP